MRDFNRNNSFGRGRSSGFNNRGSVRPAMHKATCAKCGKECEVPFRPSGEKPVFCRDCFRENGGAERRPDERNFSRPNFHNNETSENSGYKEQLAILNGKLDKILHLLTSPVSSQSPAENITNEAEITPSVEQPAPEKKKRSSQKAL